MTDATGFMLFGLGFFIFVVWLVIHTSNVAYERRLNEAREFGFGGPNQHTVETLKEK